MNTILEFFSKQGENERQMSVFIRQILSLKPSGVKLLNFSYQRGSQDKNDEQISIQGTAVTRKNFLVFSKTLETMNGVKEVQSPAVNLIKEENVEFNLTLKLSPPDNTVKK